MSNLKLYFELLESIKHEFSEADLAHIQIILACCAASRRLPKGFIKHLKQVHNKEYDHIGGLTFTGYKEKPCIPYLDIAKGLTQFVKQTYRIDIGNWIIEIQDQNRTDLMLTDTVDTEAERNAMIEKYKQLGYTHQVYCHNLEDVYHSRRTLQFVVIGKLTAADIKEIGTGVTMFNFNEEQTEASIADFMNDAALQKQLKDWAYTNKAIIHPDLLFFWESIKEAKKELVVTDKSKLRRKLYPFQEQGVDMCTMFQRTLLADDMGLGKTTQAIATIHINNAWPCLFIVPSSVVYNWVNEIREVSGKNAIILDNKSVDRCTEAQAIIITYNTAEAMGIHSQEFQSIVVDESHNVKDKSTKRYKAILNLAMGKTWRLLLTGTPILNRTEELIPQLTILGYLNEATAGVFKRDYCGNSPNIFKLESLNTKLRNMCMVKRNKADVDLQLPPVTRTIIETDITNRKQYNLILQDLAKYLETIKKLNPIEITKSMRAEALIRTNNLKRTAAEGYREQIVEFCKNALESGQSIMVFCTTHTAMDYYQKALDTPFRIDGTVSAMRRHQLTEAYQNMKDPAAFIISIRAGGVGITLTKADYAIHAEKDWVPLYHDQATSRTHRIGRTEHVNEYFFVGRDTIDNRIMQIMENKRIITEVGTGANDIATTVTTSIYKDLMKLEFDYDTSNSEVTEDGLPALA